MGFPRTVDGKPATAGPCRRPMSTAVAGGIKPRSGHDGRHHCASHCRVYHRYSTFCRARHASENGLPCLRVAFGLHIHRTRREYTPRASRLAETSAFYGFSDIVIFSIRFPAARTIATWYVSVVDDRGDRDTLREKRRHTPDYVSTNDFIFMSPTALRIRKSRLVKRHDRYHGRAHGVTFFRRVV